MSQSFVALDISNITKTSRKQFYKFYYFLTTDVVAGNPVNFRFPKGEVRKDWIDKCNEWQGTLVGCENSN